MHRVSDCSAMQQVVHFSTHSDCCMRPGSCSARLRSLAHHEPESVDITFCYKRNIYHQSQQSLLEIEIEMTFAALGCWWCNHFRGSVVVDV